MPRSAFPALPSPAALLTRRLRWTPAPRGAPVPGVGGGRWRLREIARSGERVALLCEAAAGGPLPGYHARRELLHRLDAGGPARLLVFTDAAHGEWVWCWRQREGDGDAWYREHARRGAESDAALLAELRLAARDPEPRAGRRTRGAVRQALAGRILSRALPGVLHPECRAPGRLLRELLEEGDPETAVRAVRRALLGFRALDPRCGSGAWLLEVAATLEPLWLGVLGRMRARLEDARRAGERRRPEWLRDFRLALARADEPRWLTPRHHVRQTIATLVLFGADADATSLERCRAALERWAGGPGLPALALNLRPGAGEAARPARGRGVGGEAVEAAVRAARRLRSAWLEGADAVSTAEGAERVRARLEALATERGLSPAERFGLPARPGFDLVRGAGG